VTALRKPMAEDAADETPQSLAIAAASAVNEVSHNLHGQRLGRKGRVTRERILAATVELLAGSDEAQISLQRGCPQGVAGHDFDLQLFLRFH